MMRSFGFSCLIEVRMWEVLICSIFTVGINYCMAELWQKQHMLSYTKVSRPTSLLKIFSSDSKIVLEYKQCNL